MDTPLLSVIVPVYNTEQNVNRCLDSILNQTYQNIEVIIVDDASTGEIKEIAKRYCEKNNNIKLISHDINRGLYQARMTGLNAAMGEYFAFVDSDDYLSVDFYRILINKALKERADLVASDYLEYDGKCFYSLNGMLQQTNWDLKGEEILKMLMSQRGLDDSWSFVWNKIYSMQLWKETKAKLEQVSEHLIRCENVVFSIAFFSKAKHFVNTHNNYYYYNCSAESTTNKKALDYDDYQKAIKDFTVAFTIGKSILVENEVWEQYQKDWEMWLDSAAQGWSKRIAADKGLETYQTDDLQNKIKELPISVHANQYDASRTFCSHRTKGCGEDWINEIKKKISHKECQLVSFDIFDTLIQRPFLYPSDLFLLMDCYVNQLISCTDYIVFANIRKRAELVAKEKKKANSPLWEEISLDDIYEELKMMCPALRPFCERIKQKEIELELNYCDERSLGKELFECAKASGKRIICVTDMYLPKTVITSILHKNGISPDMLYVSSEVGLTKASGSLYDYILRAEAAEPSGMVHIGDNWSADVVNARAKNITAFHFPKASDIYCGRNPAIYGGNYYKIFQEPKGCYGTFWGNGHWGERCMQAVIANRIFDNPFVFFDPHSDYNANAYMIGYQALGMHIFAVADWLLHSVMEEHYSHLNFMARDGYLVLQAFLQLNKVYKQDIKANYLYLSRKAILPLMLLEQKDYYALYNGFTLSTMTPYDFLKIAAPIIRNEKLKDAEQICKGYGVSCYKYFQTIEAFLGFSEVFFSEFFDPDKAEKYRLDLKAYLDPLFKGKTATFDVGYNARCESILRNNYGYDITAHYIHTNDDRPIMRALKSELKIKTLYPHSPSITGIMREQLMSEMSPSCVGYEYNAEGTLEPCFEEDYRVNLQTWFVTNTIQEAAMDFVSDMIAIFGEDLRSLPYRYYDVSMPLEMYFAIPASADQNIWAGTVYEDDMGMGNNKGMLDLWNRKLQQWERKPVLKKKTTVVVPSNKPPVFNYDKLPFVRRWLVILGADWNEGKRRFYAATDKHRFVRVICRGFYITGRKIVRFFK